MQGADQKPTELIDLATRLLHKSISATFLTMLGVGVEFGPTASGTAVDHNSRTVAGVIGWAGDWRGIGVFSCTPACACKLADLMLGTHNPSLNEDSLDAVAEIANIIFGSVKTELESDTTATTITTPTVVYGFSEVVTNLQEYSSMIPIMLGDYLYHVKIYFVKTSERRSALRLLSSAAA